MQFNKHINIDNTTNYRKHTLFTYTKVYKVCFIYFVLKVERRVVTYVKISRPFV